MNTPIILICGEAGAGKDTVATKIQTQTKSIAIAQADPMKRFAAQTFGFSEDQLWGPSESRNAIDKRYQNPEQWTSAGRLVRNKAREFVREVLSDLDSERQENAIEKLWKWFGGLADDHGFMVETSWQCHGSNFREVKKNPFDKQKDLTPRTMLQTLGTEWGRHIKADMWSVHALRTARKLLEGGHDYTKTLGMIPNDQAGIPDYVLITDGRFPNELVNAAQANCIRLLVKGPEADEKARAAVNAAGVAGHSSEAYLRQIPRHWYTHAIVNDKSKGLVHLNGVVKAFLDHIRAPYNF